MLVQWLTSAAISVGAPSFAEMALYEFASQIGTLTHGIVAYHTETCLDVNPLIHPHAENVPSRSSHIQADSWAIGSLCKGLSAGTRLEEDGFLPGMCRRMAQAFTCASSNQGLDDDDRTAHLD